MRDNYAREIVLTGPLTDQLVKGAYELRRVFDRGPEWGSVSIPDNGVDGRLLRFDILDAPVVGKI
ncbi:hypothetical protein [Sphingobium sp. EP60837]|nr:hypothetical protein [Sphingobium sp. EP60837]ANI79165.1 hypothetical protein EP837_02771 [Sphingobium sp. EP60837]